MHELLLNVNYFYLFKIVHKRIHKRIKYRQVFRGHQVCEVYLKAVRCFFLGNGHYKQPDEVIRAPKCTFNNVTPLLGKGCLRVTLLCLLHYQVPCRTCRQWHWWYPTYTTARMLTAAGDCVVYGRHTLHSIIQCIPSCDRTHAV